MDNKNLFKPIIDSACLISNKINNKVSSDNASEESIERLKSFNESYITFLSDLSKLEKDYDELTKYSDDNYIVDEKEEEKEETTENVIAFESSEKNIENEVEVEEVPEVQGKVESEQVQDENVEVQETKTEIELPVIEDVKEEPVQSQETNEEKEEANVELPVIEDSTKINEQVENNEEVDVQKTDLIVEEKQVDQVGSKTYVFNKKDEVQPKVISVSEYQMNKLIESKDTNEALLLTKKILGKEENVENGVNLERSLIDNGLLEESDEVKKISLEELSNKATELYKEGKVEEAQKIMDDISEINASMKDKEDKQLAA